MTTLRNVRPLSLFPFPLPSFLPFLLPSFFLPSFIHSLLSFISLCSPGYSGNSPTPRLHLISAGIGLLSSQEKVIQKPPQEAQGKEVRRTWVQEGDVRFSVGHALSVWRAAAASTHACEGGDAAGSRQWMSRGKWGFCLCPR